MKKLLLIEDDPLVANTFVNGIGQQGYLVSVAANGRDGLDLAGKIAPDLVILDLRLPDLSGIELARIFQLTGTPYIVLSACDDDDAVRCTTELGALCYLIKPLSIKQLVPVLETTLARGREVVRLRKSDEQLRGVLDTGIVVATATGILMERHDQNRRSAYEQLRGSARSRRSKVRDCATEIFLEVENRKRGTGKEDSGEDERV